jgi:hypothetical protein
MEVDTDCVSFATISCALAYRVRISSIMAVVELPKPPSVASVSDVGLLTPPIVEAI